MSPPPAMVLAAGQGTRLGGLGTHHAKATLTVAGVPLIARLLHRLRAGGVERCVINLHHLGDQVEAVVGDGSSFELTIAYSREPVLLDVAGGIANALTLLGDQPFIVANADIVSNFDFQRLVRLAPTLAAGHGHLVLGANPDFRPQGDFRLAAGNVGELDDQLGNTYLGIAAYTPAMFAMVTRGKPASMRPVWDAAMAATALSGELHLGLWHDTGTPERLAAAQQQKWD